MFNLIAVLLSMAMMLTGAAAPEGAAIEPVGRVLTLSDITLAVNGEAVTLEPTASLGVSTDGASCAYDFHIDLSGERLLPFQLSADESGLMLVSESGGATVRVSAEEIEQLVNQAMDQQLASTAPGANGGALMTLWTEEFLPAYIDVIKLAADPEASKAIQAEGERIYGEIVDRGEGTPDQVAYQDEVYDVTTYHYNLNGEQLGRLADAVYASNDVLKRYAEVYFKLLAAVSEEADAPELANADSFEALFEKLGRCDMEIQESISEEGLNITDATMTLQPSEEASPVVVTVHSEKLGDSSDAIVNCAGSADDQTLQLYMEIHAHDGAMRLMMTMGINEGEDEAEAEAEDEAEYADDADEDEPMDEADGEEPVDKADVGLIDEDGEGDEAEGAYFTLDCYTEPMEGGANGYGFSCSVEIAGEASVGFNLDGLCAADGLCENHISVYYSDGESDYSLTLQADVTDDMVESHADAENAIALADVKPETLLAGLSGDAMKLYANESVQSLMALLTPSEAEEVEADEDVEAAARSAEPYDDGELPFGEPQFSWLPEGYALSSKDVDTQYDMVNCALTNDETGDSLWCFFSASYATDEVNYYTYDADGGCAAVAGNVITEERGDGYRRYYADDGTLSVSVYPDSDAVSAEDICRIIAGISY